MKVTFIKYQKMAFDASDFFIFFLEFKKYVDKYFIFFYLVTITLV